jgi:uncharacterized protein YjiS (DUF1127 family)
MRAAVRPVFGECPSVAHAMPAPKGLIGRVRQALNTRRQRRALMALDDRMLADIGLSRSQAYCEASRPFLDVPGRLS